MHRISFEAYLSNLFSKSQNFQTFRNNQIVLSQFKSLKVLVAFKNSEIYRKFDNGKYVDKFFENYSYENYRNFQSIFSIETI